MYAAPASIAAESSYGVPTMRISPLIATEKPNKSLLLPFGATILVSVVGTTDTGGGVKLTGASFANFDISGFGSPSASVVPNPGVESSLQIAPTNRTASGSGRC